MRHAPLAAAILCLVLPGCSANDVPEPQATQASVTSTTDTSSGDTPAPTATTTGPPRGPAPLGVQVTQVDGLRQRTAYRMELPVFSGPIAAEATQRVQRSGDDGVDQFARDAPTDVNSTVEVTFEVTANDERTVQVRLDYYYYAEGAAYPLDGVSTVVLRRDDARPVLLAEVLSSPSVALAAVLRHASAVAVGKGNSDPADTLTTDLRDWADWQAGPAGLTFFFDDGQAGSHATGLRQVEVPWSIVRPWVRQDAYELLGPPDRG